MCAIIGDFKVCAAIFEAYIPGFSNGAIPYYFFQAPYLLGLCKFPDFNLFGQKY